MPARTKRKSKKVVVPKPYNPAPDLRAAFVAESDKMVAEFDRTIGTGHEGAKGDLREAELRSFLKRYLPMRFGVGSGQLVHPSNLMSKQCDIVIYDQLNIPRLTPDDSHSMFPVESVHAVIEVKSSLESGELKEAFANLQSAYRVANDPNPYGPGGRWHGERSYGPSCFVFGFSCERSLDAIANQVRTEWPATAGRVEQPPPLITALGKGLVGPPQWLMLNRGLDELVTTRATGRHSLLRFFMHLLGDLTGKGISMPEFSLQSYLWMPTLLEGKRVWQHFWMFGFGQLSTEVAVSDASLVRIMAACANQPPLKFSDFYRDRLGRKEGTSRELGRKRTFVFNPKNLKLDVEREPNSPPRVPAMVIAVDDALYVIAHNALEPDDFVATNPEVVELFKPF